MNPIVEELRARWWKTLVAILWIALPLFCVTAWMIAPFLVLLDGDKEGMNQHQMITFQTIARYQGSGDYMVILLAYFQLTTASFEVFRVANICLLMWTTLANLIAWITAIYFQTQIDPWLFTIVDFIDWLLQGYMCYMIFNRKRDNEEATSLV